ncbi:FAD:protein FMN transferase [Bacteroidales bacterium OttesenSCG-928-B11]|nr:FAD:protein FMN transferase [Bacteroidales bacterium OttesenSCG-928-E04]MDL2308137.1 FAD:protein FMN transferase [Bacteroidales bacterium OttesenSCG-928-C03]MDL2311508.1 FAD:protein FMN transferase [Bacteroidales bacterium OttesenSCG-928-B11]MDL2325563.1 FAD:protein FMN transferase [Bacteroidales bacterium OttesenSCG-928-A14]
MRFRRFFHSLLLIIAAASCAQNDLHKINGNGLGTYYQITYIGKDAPDLKPQIDSLLQYYSQQFSIFDTTSIVHHLNINKTNEVPDEFINLIEKSLEISLKTGGAFDITIAPLVSYWGFAQEEFTSIDSAHIDSLRSFIGYQNIIVSNNVLLKTDDRIKLNFNAIAKGYIVDRVTDFLLAQGFNNFIVDIGGEMFCMGDKNGKPWQVGIQRPTSDRNGNFDSAHILPLTSKAIATSGNYRNYKELNGERYTHIINPKTGFPERSSLLSVSVIANDCATADALATAFMVMGLEESTRFLEANPEYEALFISIEEEGFKISGFGSSFPSL